MKVMATGSAYVSTCPYESWGITALEALTHGLPLVLVTDSSGTHASQNVAAADSDYVLISKSIKLREFEELLERYRGLSHADRVAISERTKAKHSKASWIAAVSGMFSGLS
jgi:glycosyltransferase involved in cell wall biosynthesis